MNQPMFVGLYAYTDPGHGDPAMIGLIYININRIVSIEPTEVGGETYVRMVVSGMQGALILKDSPHEVVKFIESTRLGML